MKKRPLLFVLLGILHLLEPIGKLLYFKWDTGLDWNIIIDNLAQMEGFKNIFDFWMLFPLGGIALLMVKAWTYPLFVGVQVYSVINHLLYEKYTWPYLSERPFLGAILLLSFNLLIIIYFSLPMVRRPFFDRRMRWWESRPRYGGEIPCLVELTGLHKSFTSKIFNISEGGAFVEKVPGLSLGETVKIKFSLHNFSFDLTGKIVNSHQINAIDGFGLQFFFTNTSERADIKKFIKELKKTFKNSFSLEMTT